MGLSIDKAIKEVQQQKLDYQEFWEEYKNEHIEALDMAISIMRKYKKIQEVMDSRPDDDAKSNSKALGEIEVIMYGNDD